LNKISARTALNIVFGLLLLGVFIYFPKIYIRNNIYYTSKDINRLYAHYISLQEENTFLAQQLEDMKFKNQIMDSLLFNPLDKLNNKNLNSLDKMNDTNQSDD